MHAIIIAGGFGTRLRPLTYTIPKPLVEIASKPVLLHTIKKIESAGIEGVIVATNFMADKIESFINSQDWLIPVKCVSEKYPLGTAGAVKNCEKLLDDDFMVLQGDSINSIDLENCIKAHSEGVTITVKPVENPGDFGIVKLGKNNRIVKFLEKPGPEQAFSNLANTGIYVMDRGMLEHIPNRRQFDFSLDLFPLLMKRKVLFSAHVAEDYWVDVGRIQNYLKANEWMMSRHKFSLADDSSNISESAALIKPYIIGKNTIIKPGARIGPFSVIGDSCIIGKNAIVEKSIVYDHTIIGDRASIQTSVAGDKCTIAENSAIQQESTLGSGTSVGRGAVVQGGSRIGPFIKIRGGMSVQGVMAPSSTKMSFVQKALQLSPTFMDMERNNLRVCLALAEYGELSHDAISSLSNMPKEQLDTTLQKLQELGLVRLNQKMFSMLYEEPHLLSRYVNTHLLKKVKKLIKKRK